MAYLEVANLSYAVPGGRVLFEDVSFRVPEGKRVALVGANGTGKTTLLRLIAGEDKPKSGHLRTEGRVAYLRQFVGSANPHQTIRDFLLSLAPASVQKAARTLAAAEHAIATTQDPAAHTTYAAALTSWGDAGGYEAEVLWNTCTTAAFGLSLDHAGGRVLGTLSGGEQKRLALECLFRSDAHLLLLDEPDNFLDIPGKRWLEGMLTATRKTVLFVSHDRALLAATTDRVVTLEAKGAWTHPESFATYAEARQARIEQIEDEQRRYREKHARLVTQMREFKRRAAISPKFASRAKAAVTKLERYERENAPRDRPDDQDIRMDLGGGRTGKLVLRLEKFSIPGLVEPFDTEIHYGERVGIVGGNGTGKSQFLKLLSGEPIEHAGEYKLGARVEPSLFSQLHERPELIGQPLTDVLRKRGFELGPAISALKRYELHQQSRLPFELLSGGQQARFQLLVMETESPTMLLLDEPTDNLDVDSADALEEGLLAYKGTVLAVTHDRWFMLLLDRFLVFNDDGSVTESLETPYT
jgi:ATPase subunit of ABC transporter with duplicated ATPase domains